ncbi:MAG: hypothetical protein GVY20_16790 [Bacteroidetes bacterium]|jgi:hypothetical protein|nr:hypothetical protein [Bacteroidota bacterium]
MLRFFRHIRKKLMEQNKVRTYLLYAIGEILLVVIGILIALQVNNWNEDRKDQQLTVQYLMSLREDLREDFIMLNAGYDFAYSDSIRLASQISRIKKNDAHPDTVKKIVLFEYVPQFRNPRPFNRKTYRALISTGDIGLLDNELTERLMQLVKDQDVRNGLMETANSGYGPAYLSMSHDFPMSGMPFSESRAAETYESINTSELLDVFNVVAFTKMNTNEKIMTRSRVIEPQTEELIDMISAVLVN